jgi:hypothetical protein
MGAAAAADLTNMAVTSPCSLTEIFDYGSIARVACGCNIYVGAA